MGYFVRVWGELSLTTEQLGAWRETTADASKWTDWQGELAAPSPAVQVGPRLDAYSDWPGGDDEPEFLNVRVGDDGCVFRGWLDEESFREMASTLAAVVRCAESAGARGDVTFAADTGDFAYRVVLDASGSRLETPLGEGLWRPSDVTAQRELDAWPADRARRQAERKAEREAAGAAPILDDILEALAAATPMTLRISSSKTSATTSTASGSLPLFKAYKDGAVLLDELRRGSERLGPDERSAIAIELLCRVDADRGWRLAERALGLVGPGVSALQIGAVRGLGATTYRAALDLLISAAESLDEAVAAAAVRALVAFDHPEVDRALSAAVRRSEAGPAKRGSRVAEALAARRGR